MIIGITGSQRGATRAQLQALTRRLVELGCVELHHGDCIGADAQAHETARALGLRIVIHPPMSDAKRAFCAGDEVRPVRQYLDRNHDIVDASDVIIGLPATRSEAQRSGTWATIRYARKVLPAERVEVITP